MLLVCLVMKIAKAVGSGGFGQCLRDKLIYLVKGMAS